jgi:23S rRNA (cytidine1920-2'-O)/16S rRNA (cytidine1409-2'-O)-methyltransferase
LKTSYKKPRLDVLLVEKEFFQTRSRAQAAIMAGLVFVNGEKIEKAGQPVAAEAVVEIHGEKNPYVSRGGLKLEAALEEFGISPAGLVCLDIGASTGGFTDCLLQKGARCVYAVDVGRGQLAWKLRKDVRVVVIEKTNARYLKLEDLVEAQRRPASGGPPLSFQKLLPFQPPQLAVMDVSFISVLKIFPVFQGLLTPDAKIISLIKPQFEAGRQEVEKGGLVKNPLTHIKVLKKITEETAGLGFVLEKLTFSPITGADGNIEYFGLWSKKLNSSKIKAKIDIENLVSGAFKNFRRANH